MRKNQVYTKGIITNHKPFKRSETITFILELITLASVLAIVTLLAILIQ